MKLTKTEAVISCDVPGCTRLSTYSLTFGCGRCFYLCADCAKKLKKEMIGLKEKENA